MLDHEIGYCGLDTEPSRHAADVQTKLRAIHAHGWEHDPEDML
jgi:hypothetical protein